MIRDMIALCEKFFPPPLTLERPGFLPRERMTERLELLEEEVKELRIAVEDNDLPAAADALVDIVVVAIATAVMMALPWETLWSDVQRANMSKMRGVGPRGHSVDLIKPSGWRGPQTEWILRDHGWKDEAAPREKEGGGSK